MAELFGKFGVYVVDPQIYIKEDPNIVDKFLEHFGWNKGYLICALPDYESLYAWINEETNNNPKRKKIIELLVKHRNAFCQRNCKYESTFWNEQVQEEIQHTQINAIFTEKDTEKFIDNIPIYTLDSIPANYFSEYQELNGMIWDDLVKLLKPWFLNESAISNILKFIDPYFNPYKLTFQSFLNSIIQILSLHDRYLLPPRGKCKELSSFLNCYSIEIHLCTPLYKYYKWASNDQEFITDIQQGFAEYMRMQGRNIGANIFDIFIWKRNSSMHNRFFFVWNAGFTFSHGLEDGCCVDGITVIKNINTKIGRENNYNKEITTSTLLEKIRFTANNLEGEIK